MKTDKRGCKVIFSEHFECGICVCVKQRLEFWVKRKQYVEALALAQSLSDGTAKGTTDFVGSGAKRKDLVAEQVVERI